MKTGPIYGREEQAMLILMPYLKKLCHRRWSNLEPEDRLSEAVLFTLCAVRSLPINSGHFISDLNKTLLPYMDKENRKAPPRFYGRDRSLDHQKMAAGNDKGKGSWNLYATLTGSQMDDSCLMVRSFSNTLPQWQKNLLRDLEEKDLSKSEVASKYAMSVNQLERILMQLGADYQAGNWSDR